MVRGTKIKRSMISDYENMGLKMFDLNSFNKALKLAILSEKIFKWQ